MTDKLKPCPFCGGTAKELTEGYVSCSNRDCPMSAMSMTVESWNNRAPDPLVAELVAALRNIYICLASDDIYRWETVLENIEKALAKARGEKE